MRVLDGIGNQKEYELEQGDRITIEFNANDCELKKCFYQGIAPIGEVDFLVVKKHTIVFLNPDDILSITVMEKEKDSNATDSE